MSHSTLPHTTSTTIRVVDLVEFPMCPDCDDADRVYQLVEEQFHNGQDVILCFEGIDFILPMFLAHILGRLLREYTEEEVRSRIKVVNLKPDLVFMVEAVIKSNVAYLKDPERCDRAFEKSLRGFKEDF